MKRSWTLHSHAVLAVIAAGIISPAAATTIYVDDNWGAAPARSASTFPYEDKAETRYYLHVQNGKFYSQSKFEIDEATGLVTATAGPAEDGPANGIDYVYTGIDQDKNYFDNTGFAYNQAPTGVNDPTTAAAESFSLTLGTSAFGNIGDAIYAIGKGTAQGVDAAGTATGVATDIDKIVVLSGIYYETLWIPNNNSNAGASNNVYYNAGVTTRAYGAFPGTVTNAEFTGKLGTNFTITGDPIAKPVVTRGAYFDGEKSEGFTLSNLVFNGNVGSVSGATAGNGVHPTGYKSTGGATAKKVIDFNGTYTNTTDPTVLPGAIAAAATTGYRRNLTINGVVIDALGVRVPFARKSPVTAFTPAYTTAPAYSNESDSNGGLWGIQSAGEFGTYTFTNNTIRGTRGFATLDTAQANGANAGWSQIIFEGNTITDVWGSLALRGQTNAVQQVSPRSDYASVKNNTFRNLGEGLLTVYVNDGGNLRPYDASTDGSLDFTTTFPAFIHNHNTQGGGFLKIFQVRDADVFNNSFIYVQITRDWFQKPAASLVPPGHPDFLPMGAGILLRDIRNATTNPNGPWTDFSDYRVIGNLFESLQQGIAIDGPAPPSQAGFIPGGRVEDNSFVRCRSGFYNYNSRLSSIALSFTNNIFTEFTNDPLGTGVGAGSNVEVVGGVVLDTLTEASTENPVLDAADNFFQGGANGPNGFVLNSPTVDGDNVSGDQVGESLDSFPNLDRDGDGIANATEDSIGTNPDLADTDGDGLTDGIEVRVGTNPLSNTSPSATADADGDKLPDATELILGTNPTLADSDGDGIRDDYEVLVGTDANNAGQVPSFGDANEDGLTNNQDAIRILEAFLSITVLNVTNRDRVDINRDGLVNNVDAVILYQRVLGNIDYLPFP